MIHKLGRYWYSDEDGGRLFRAPYNSTEVDFDFLYANPEIIDKFVRPAIELMPEEFGVKQLTAYEAGDEREQEYLIYCVLNDPVCDDVWEAAYDATRTIAVVPSAASSVVSSVGPGRTAADAIHVPLKRPRSPIDIVDLLDDEDLPAVQMRSIADEMHLSRKRPLDVVDLVSVEEEPYRKIQMLDLLDDPEYPDAWVEDVEDGDDSTYQPSMDVSSWHPNSQQARVMSRDGPWLRSDAAQPKIDQVFRSMRFKQPGYRRNWRDDIINMLDEGSFDRYMEDLDYISDDEDVPPHSMGPRNVPMDVFDLTDDMSEITGSSGVSSVSSRSMMSQIPDLAFINRSLIEDNRAHMWHLANQYNPDFVNDDSDSDSDY